MLVVGGSVAAFLAPPFTGLDTLPALGVVLLSLAVLLEDIAIVLLALVVGISGVALEILLGAALIDAIRNLLRSRRARPPHGGHDTADAPRLG